jgi:hypothetical protein
MALFTSKSLPAHLKLEWANQLTDNQKSYSGKDKGHQKVYKCVRFVEVKEKINQRHDNRQRTN